LPGTKALLSYDPATTVPVAGAFDDSALQAAVGPLPRTPLREGIAQTLRRFEWLLRTGRLDAREVPA
jgi:hypothetical protein